MTDDRSVERAARSWLEDGPTTAPDRPVEDALARIETTRQERGPLVPWRLPTMNLYMRFAAAAVLAVVAIGGAVYLLGDGGGGVGTAPTPSPTEAPSPTVAPTPTPTPAPTPIDTSTWTSFASATYAFSLLHPDDWTINPSTHVWTLEEDGAEFGGTENAAAEIFHSADGGLGISAWSVAVEPGTTLEDFVAAYCEMNTTPCTDIQGRAEPIVAEGGDPYSGVLVPFEGDIQAFFPTWYDEGASESIWTQPASAEGQIYAIASWRPEGESDSRRLIEEFVRSLCIGCGG